MKRIKKILIGILILIIFVSLNSTNSKAFLGFDDLFVAGIGCISGGIIGSTSCYPYSPPTSGYECGICNEQNPNNQGDPFGECTEYKCRSIGSSCRYIPSLNNPEEKGVCVRDDSVASLYSAPPKIVNCNLIDLDTYQSKNVHKTSNSCDLGSLSLSGHYALILTTDKVGECRISTIPNNEHLFDLPPNEVDAKFIKIMGSLPNGKDQYHPIYFNEGWTLQNIQEFNSANPQFYVKCADFISEVYSPGDYSFTHKVEEGLGDINAPVIIKFTPTAQNEIQKYYVSRNTQNVNMKLFVTDFSGIQECRYSNENIGFDQMQRINCRNANDNETLTGYEGENIQICETSLTNIGDGVSDFYFNCKDSSPNGNIAPLNYYYNVIKTDPLALTINSPTQGQIIDGINDNFQVRTSGGIGGVSTCTFNFNRIGDEAGVRQDFESYTSGQDISLHTQALDFFPEDGQYNLNVQCTDLIDETNTAQGSVTIEYVRPSPISIPTPPGQVPRQCQLQLIWTDLRGNPINNEVEDGTRVIASIRDVNCISSGAPLSSDNINLGLFELDQRGILGDEEEDVTQSLNFNNQVRFGDKQNIVSFEWIAKYIEDQGVDGPNPKYMFKVINSNPELKSNVLRVKPSSGDDDTPPVVPTGEECNLNSISWIENNDQGRTISTIENGRSAVILFRGRDCSIGDSVIYRIKEKEVRFGLDALAEDDLISEGEILFNTENIAFVEWTSIRQSNDNFPDNEYYAEVGNIKSSLLRVTTSPGGDQPGQGCQINNCPGILNSNSVCVDIPGDNCPASDSADSSLIVSGLGPSGNVQDTRVNVFVNLRAGPSDFGRDAECRFTDIPSHDLASGTSTLLFPQVLNYGGDIVGDSTRYSKQIDFNSGQHVLYVKCKDSQSKYTALQTISFNVQLPTSQVLDIIRTAPSGTIGNNIAQLEVETQGGANEGANVQCIFRGISSNARFTESITAPKQQITGNRYRHILIPTDFADGNQIYEVQCADNSGQTDSGEIIFTVQRDTTAPEIRQIVTKGSVKFITLSEAAICQTATGTSIPNENQWVEVSRETGNEAKQLINLAESYYFRCSDQWGNQLDTVRINL